MLADYKRKFKKHREEEIEYKNYNYDYMSVMHCGSKCKICKYNQRCKLLYNFIWIKDKDFSTNGKPTIEVIADKNMRTGGDHISDEVKVKKFLLFQKYWTNCIYL